MGRWVRGAEAMGGGAAGALGCLATGGSFCPGTDGTGASEGEFRARSSSTSAKGSLSKSFMMAIRGSWATLGYKSSTRRYLYSPMGLSVNTCGDRKSVV